MCLLSPQTSAGFCAASTADEPIRVPLSGDGVMNIGRRQFAVAGLSSAALAALHGAAFADDRTRAGSGPDAMFDKCAKACSACERACDYCETYCTDALANGGKHHLAVVKTCRDCADICAAAAGIVAREGDDSDVICQACAESCGRCAKECEQHGKDDAVMSGCAKECRACEKACREMLAHAAGKRRQ